jgi:isopentenyldiphosphate isomerase
MSEKLEIYNLKSELIKIQDRKKFYKEIKEEYKKTGKITKKVKTIRLLLMNSKGKIVLQKRNSTKEENPNLYDKTIGGHVEEEDSYELTLIKECSEELGFPVSVLKEQDFSRAIKKTDLRIIGIFKEMDYDDKFMSERIIKGTKKKIIQPVMCTFYVGYYNGPIQFIDGESSGIQLYTLDELKQEMKTNPNKFTNDIKVMIKKYSKYLKPINNK